MVEVELWVLFMRWVINMYSDKMTSVNGSMPKMIFSDWLFCRIPSLLGIVSVAENTKECTYDE